jgi:hypothetical protein
VFSYSSRFVGKPEVSTMEEKSPCRTDDCAELYSRVTGKEEALKTSRLGPGNVFPAPNPSLSVLRPRRASGRSADSAAFKGSPEFGRTTSGQIGILSHSGSGTQSHQVLVFPGRLDWRQPKNIYVNSLVQHTGTLARDYSVLKATIGSTRVLRQAGIKAASVVVMARITIVSTIVAASEA